MFCKEYILTKFENDRGWRGMAEGLRDFLALFSYEIPPLGFI